jgi:hypothetical protein
VALIETRNRFLNLLATVGRAAIHSQFPDDFEYYLCALELVRTDDSTTEEFLVFPVMPSMISVTEPKESPTGLSRPMNSVAKFHLGLLR